MKRRSVFRAAGCWGLLSALPVSGCAAGSKSGATVSPDASLPGTTAISTDPTLEPTPGSTAGSVRHPPRPDVIGGQVLQANGKRQSVPSADVVKHSLLPAAVALYRAALPGSGNAVLSPYSIVAALGMLAFGARGATATSLANVLGADAATVSRWLSAADAALAGAVADSKQGQYRSSADPTVIEPANVLFLQRDLQVRAAYLEALAAGYGAGVRQLDFADSAAARAAINGWVAQRTHDLIPHLLPEGSVDPRTLLVLVNALYLKASWATPFLRGRTNQGFITPDRVKVAVPFMTWTGTAGCARGPNWQSVSIPLVAQLAMTVIVPDAGFFSQITDRLDAGLLAAAAAGGQRSVEVAMPAFHTDTPTDLRKPLGDLGLAELFDAPDLSGITGPAGRLYLSGAFHQARIAVNDHGVEAAAATAVVIMTSSVSVPDLRLRVDRPFLYLLHDVATVTPLFLGRVTDPSA